MHFVGWWFQEQWRHPQLFWLYLVSNQMEKWCPISHLIICHQGLVSYFPLPPGLEQQHAFFNFSCNSSSHPQFSYVCSVLFIIVFVKFYITWKRPSTVDRHQCWLRAGARSHARNIQIANEHAFFLSVHFILFTVMLYRWVQIVFFVFLVSTDNCEWKRTHGQR